MTEMVLLQEVMLIKVLRCAVFLNCHRLRALWPRYSGLAIKNELFHSSGNYEACLSVLYALGIQLYHPLQITWSTNTQRGCPWFCLSACGGGGFVPHQLLISTHLNLQKMSWSLKTFPEWSASGFRGSKALGETDRPGNGNSFSQVLIFNLISSNLCYWDILCVKPNR